MNCKFRKPKIFHFSFFVFHFSLLIFMVFMSLSLMAIAEPSKNTNIQSTKTFSSSATAGVDITQPSKQNKQKKSDKKQNKSVESDIISDKDFLTPVELAPTPKTPVFSFGRLLISLLIVCGLIYFTVFILKFFWARGLRLDMKSHNMKIIDTLSIGINRSLFFVYAGGHLFLLASADKGITLLAEIKDPEEVHNVLEEYNLGVQSSSEGFSSYLNTALGKENTAFMENVENIDSGGAKNISSILTKLKDKLTKSNEPK